MGHALWGLLSKQRPRQMGNQTKNQIFSNCCKAWGMEPKGAEPVFLACSIQDEGASKAESNRSSEPLSPDPKQKTGIVETVEER